MNTKSMFINSAYLPVCFTLNLAQWVKAVYTGSKRANVRHYIATNLSDMQVSYNRAETVRNAVRSVGQVRSAHASARDAFRAEYAIARICADGLSLCNPKNNLR